MLYWFQIRDWSGAEKKDNLFQVAHASLAQREESITPEFYFIVFA